MYLFVMIF